VEAVYDYTGRTVGAVYCGGQGGDQGTRALVTNLYGGSYTNADHTAYTWDSYENIAALKTLYDCEGIEYDPSLVGGDEIALFYNGMLNMAFCWNIAQQKNPCNANTGAGKTANGDEIMFMSFPSPNGTDAQLQGGIRGFGIFDNGNSAKIEAAKQFITYCCDSQATADAARTSSYFPVRSSAEGTDLTGIWADDAIMQDYSVLMPLMGDYYQVTPNWAVARTNWWNMLQLVGEYGYSEEMITAIAQEYTIFCNNP
jgi:multiple sugar transport system substrate-binding protein